MRAPELQFRDPARARGLSEALHRVFEQVGRERVTLMHVCGSHEQAIAKYGLRSLLPPGLDVIMGPGCPVCVTDAPEVDEGVALSRQGVRVLSYGDMMRVPGTALSLADAAAEGGKVEVVYGISQAVEIARASSDEVVFFATGFETTAVTTAAAILAGVPPNFSVLSAHKFIPPAMEIVASLPESRIEGFLAAGHAATITGYGVFEPLAERFRLPIVVGGFEPLDILAGLVRLLELVRDGAARVENMYPRCVTRDGNREAQRQMWEVFEPARGCWRGIAEVPDGNLRLRERWAAVDARRRFVIDLAGVSSSEAPELMKDCICGDIMTGQKTPDDCRLFGRECLPDRPVGACMVSTEGTCRIWHQYGSLRPLARVEVAS